MIVGSAGTSGTDSGVDWVAGIVEQIAAEEGLTLRLAHIYSELSNDELPPPARAGSIEPLAPLGADHRRAARPVRAHRRPARCRAVHRRARRRGRRDHRRPGDRHRGDRRRRAAPRLSARPDVARGQDRRVRRPVHDQPAGRRRAGRDRRRRVHRRAARADVGVHPAVGGRPHDLRERQPATRCASRRARST